MYSAISSDKTIPFDLFHEKTIDYISADSYVFYKRMENEEYARFDDYADPNAILIAYKVYLSGKPDTLSNFTDFVNTVNIRTDKDDVCGVTDAPLLQHISGEIRGENNVDYFIFYGKYYHLSKSYIERLTTSLARKLRKEFITDELTTKWIPEENEDWFNKTVAAQEGYIYLHNVKSDYIEFADLLKFENDVVTVVHVKDGFGCNMRALDRQVELSVAKVMDIKYYNNEDYMRKLYKNASGRTIETKITTVFSTVDEFLSCIKDKRIRYIIAIRTDEEDLLSNQSNIAKHCLNALILRCFERGIELKIQTL